MRRLLVVLMITTAGALFLSACDTNGPTMVDADGFASPNDCAGTGTVPKTIQGGVTLSEPGGDVIVCPGTYSDDAVINKTVRLLGPKAGLDGRTRATSGEAVITGTSASSKIDVTADNVEIDGFLFQAVTGTDALHTASTASGYTIHNNIFNNNQFGLYLNASGATLSSVERNLFVNNNNTSGGSASAGNGLYSDQGLKGADIHDNKFQDNTNAALCLCTNVRNVSVHNNASVNDSSFVVAAGTVDNPDTSIKVINNTVNDTFAGDNASQGSQIFASGVNGFVVKGNTLTNGPANGVAIRDLYGPPLNVTLISNSISNATGSGIDVSSANYGAVTAKSNTLNSNGEAGIRFESPSNGNRIATNSASGNGTFDCHDESIGGNRAGVANFWATDNIGSTSSPAGLCHP
jgi:hypothetical protein